MLVQLIMIGYFLSYIFNSNNSLIILLILIFMVLIASWISLGAIKRKEIAYFGMHLFPLLLVEV